MQIHWQQREAIVSTCLSQCTLCSYMHWQQQLCTFTATITVYHCTYLHTLHRQQTLWVHSQATTQSAYTDTGNKEATASSTRKPAINQQKVPRRRLEGWDQICWFQSQLPPMPATHPRQLDMQIDKSLPTLQGRPWTNWINPMWFESTCLLDEDWWSVPSMNVIYTIFTFHL